MPPFPAGFSLALAGEPALALLAQALVGVAGRGGRDPRPRPDRRMLAQQAARCDAHHPARRRPFPGDEAHTGRAGSAPRFIHNRPDFLHHTPESGIGGPACSRDLAAVILYRQVNWFHSQRVGAAGWAAFRMCHAPGTAARSPVLRGLAFRENARRDDPLSISGRSALCAAGRHRPAPAPPSLPAPARRGCPRTDRGGPWWRFRPLHRPW